MQMIDLTQGERDDLLDALMDLKHDLGKYIYLPLAMTANDAAGESLRLAIETCLLRTRVSRDGTPRPAEEIWRSFLEECEGSISSFSTFEALSKAVTKALGWSERLKEVDLDTATATRDLARVSEAISETLREVAGG